MPKKKYVVTLTAEERSGLQSLISKGKAAASNRESNIDGADEALDELRWIVAQIREEWPDVQIVIRGDSGFCREEIMEWCEQNNVEYILGLAKNSVLKEAIAQEMAQAKALYEQTQEPSRVFKDFCYKTKSSWNRRRRVIGKAEYVRRGENPRFVVTSLASEAIDARCLYEDHYCARGDMENRIKEQQLDMFADRTSTHQMRSNQLRLWFSMASAHPYRPIFVAVYNNLRAIRCAAALAPG
jgi:hypothetical protein